MVMDVKKIDGFSRNEKLNISDIKKNSDNNLGLVISKNKQKEFIFTIVLVSFLLVLISLFLYFYFSSVRKVEKRHVVETDSLRVHYEETKTGMGDVVTLGYTYSPHQDEYYFVVQNKTKKKIAYSVFLEKDLEMIEMDGCSSSLFSEQLIDFSINDSKRKSLFSVFDGERYLLNHAELMPSSKKKYKISFSVLDKDHPQNHYHAKFLVLED